MHVRTYVESDRSWAEPLVDDRLGRRIQVRRGEAIDVLALPGFVAEEHGEPAGILTYRHDGDAYELAMIVVKQPHLGTGTALLDRLRELAGPSRIWVVTTNDNLDALRFYQRRGFELTALRAGAVEASRRLKPEIGAVGAYGIALRDELELELRP